MVNIPANKGTDPLFDMQTRARKQGDGSFV